MYAALHRPPQSDAPAVPLTAIAADFSPRYERHHDDLVSIDVSGLARLLGSPQTIGEELRREAASRGVRVHIAIARTRMAAMVLALARPGVTIVARGDEAAALAPIPVVLLEKIYEDGPPGRGGSRTAPAPAADAVAAFKTWGLKTLGDVAALPPADLIARLGPPARVWQAIARGDDMRPLMPTLPEERFDSSLELEWPIEGLEPLSFVLTRLLEPLSTRLERRDRGAAVLHVILRLVTRDEYARRLELPSPLRDVRTLRTLALLDLEAHPPAAAIDRVTIVIDPTPGRVLQHALFTRAQPTPEQLSTLAARLGALMGQDRFGAPAVVDSYRPGAFEMVPFKMDHESNRGDRRERRVIDREDSAGSANSAVAVVQGLRRCRHPVPARVSVENGRPVRVTTDRRGFAGGSVVHCVGPWRSSGNWWTVGRPGGPGRSGGPGGSGGSGKNSVISSHQAHQTSTTHETSHQAHLPHQTYWDRDEWDIALTDRAAYRIFRDRETDQWFIDAIVD